MKLGCQSGPTSDQRLQFFKRHSVDGICGYPEDPEKKGYYSVEDLSKIKERCEKHKIGLDCIAPPFLASSHVDRTERPAIMLGQSPERDRDIEAIQNIIRNCAKVGIPAIKYNMSLLGVLRTETNARARRFDVLHLAPRGGENKRQIPSGNQGRTGKRGSILGAHHVLPGSCNSGGE